MKAKLFVCLVIAGWLLGEMLYGQKVALGLSGCLSRNHIYVTSGLPTANSRPGVGGQLNAEIKYQFHPRLSFLFSSGMGLYNTTFSYPDRNNLSILDHHEINSIDLGSIIGIGYLLSNGKKRSLEILGHLGPRWGISMNGKKSGSEIGDPRPDSEMNLGTLFYAVNLQSTTRTINNTEICVGLFLQNRLPFQFMGFENSGFLHSPIDARMTFLTYGLCLKFRIHV